MIRARFTSFAVGALLGLFTGAIYGEGTKIRTDLYGDPLPPGAVARLGTMRLRHAGAEMAFSADGKRLISCDNEGVVRVWEVATGRRLKEKQLSWERQPAAGNVVLAPDGATAARSEGKALCLYDTSTGQERGRLPFDESAGRFSLQTFSPDGKLLAVQTAGERREFHIQIWDVAAVKKRQTLKTPPDIRLSRVAFTWDGTRLAGIASKSDGSGKLGGVLFDLFLWDTATGKLMGRREDLRRLEEGCLAFSPDGKTLAVGCLDEGRVRWLESATLKGKKLPIPAAEGGNASITDLAFSPDGRQLAAAFVQPSAYGALIWDLAGEKKARRLPTRYGIARLAFSPDSKTLACREAAEIRLYDAASGRPLHHRPGHNRAELVLATSSDGKVIASGDRAGVLRLWDAATNKQLRMLEGDGLPIVSCFFSSNGKQLVSVGKSDAVASMMRAFVWGEEKTTFQVWDVATGKALRQFEIKGLGVLPCAAAISADGKRLAAIVYSPTEDLPGQRIVWDVATGERLSQKPYKFAVRVLTEDYTEIITLAAFAPDGERMTVWLGDRAGIEEVATGCLLAELPRNVGVPLDFSPDGRLLAAARWKLRKGLRYFGGFGLALIETASGEEVLRLDAKEHDGIVFTPDGQGVVVADSEGLCVWDTATGAKLHQWKWPESLGRTASETGGQPVRSLIALAGGRVATGMTEGDILIWDLALSTWPARKPVGELSRAKLDVLWSDLAGDAPKAHRAVYQMTTAPAQTVPFLKDHLRLAATDDKRIEKLLADLDSDSFTAREAAVRELTRLHYRIEPVLRKRLESKPSLEMRRRLESILAGPKKLLPDDLRRLRAIAVLERIGTPEARRVLENLASGAACRETHEAQAALQRLKRR